jgi:hypothetical protein
VRGQITAQLQRVRVVVSVVTVLVAAALFDWDPLSYRYVFPGAALLGLLGIWMAPRLHVRGERSELKRHRRPQADDDFRSGMVEPFSLTALISPGHVLGQMYRVLRNDRRFAQYCFAQLLVGTANLMTISIIVAVVTRDLQSGDAWGFWISTALIVALPRLCLLGSAGRWGRLLDRVGVVRFRVVTVSCLAVSFLIAMIATLVSVNADYFGPVYFPLGVALFALRGILNGVSHGGATLAWHIGHLHFARPEEAEIYMGIHVSLTGLRGLIAPLAGMWLWYTIGWPVWLIALALSSASVLAYWLMARHEQRMGMPNARDAAAE